MCVIILFLFKKKKRRKGAYLLKMFGFKNLPSFVWACGWIYVRRAQLSVKSKNIRKFYDEIQMV